MNLGNIDVNRCKRSDKEVIEGLCLSFDMIKEICLETKERCVAIEKDKE